MARKHDEIDKRIIYRLTEDARNTSAPDIAREVGVSPGTIRNRIKKLEERGVIRGYHAHISYELIENHLVSLFICSTEIKYKTALARKAAQIPGVVNVRQVMSGQGNLHLKVVGSDMKDLAAVASQLAELGLSVEAGELLEEESFRPYSQFGPTSEERRPLVNFTQIAGHAESATLKMMGGSSLAQKSLKEINELGLLPDELLVVAIEREDRTIVPKGSSKLEVGDVVSIFSSTGIDESTLDAFSA